MGRSLRAWALCVLGGWGCTHVKEGWRQTHFGDGTGPSLAEARCWVVRCEDGRAPGSVRVDTVFPESNKEKVWAADALPGLLKAGDAGTYVGAASPVWCAFSGMQAGGNVDVRFEILHVCGSDDPAVDGALAAFAQPDRPWMRWGLACWCAPAGDDRPWREDEPVELTTVVYPWPADTDHVVDTVSQTWNWGEEDQVLPVVLKFIAAHPRGGRLVCPVWEAFGPAGLPSAGWLPEETVVLDLATQRPDLRPDHEDARPLVQRRNR